MKKHLFAILMLVAAMLPLSGCGGEQAAPKKAAVDVKAAKPAPQAAAKAAAAKAVPAAPKPAADASKPASPQKPATAGTAEKAPAPDAQKTAAKAQKGAAPKPAAPGTQELAAEAQTAAADVQPDELPPPLTVPKGYRYEPRGRRDPFVNPIPKPVATAEAPVVRPDGLPGVLVNELKVSGIIYAQDPSMKKAILAAGRKTYFAKQGDHLFDAVIKEIRPNEVVFSMVSTTTKKPLNRETVVSTGSLSSSRR